MNNINPMSLTLNTDELTELHFVEHPKDERLTKEQQVITFKKPDDLLMVDLVSNRELANGSELRTCFLYLVDSMQGRLEELCARTLGFHLEALSAVYNQIITNKRVIISGQAKGRIESAMNFVKRNVVRKSKTEMEQHIAKSPKRVRYVSKINSLPEEEREALLKGVTIIPREDAKAQGLKYYHTGNFCRNGHFDKRLVSSGLCVTCVRNNRMKEMAKKSK